MEIHLPVNCEIDPPNILNLTVRGRASLVAIVYQIRYGSPGVFSGLLGGREKISRVEVADETQSSHLVIVLGSERYFSCGKMLPTRRTHGTSLTALQSVR